MINYLRVVTVALNMFEELQVISVMVNTYHFMAPSSFRPILNLYTPIYVLC